MPGVEGDEPAADAPWAPDIRQPDVAWMVGMAAGCARGLVAGRRRALETVLAARFGPLEAGISDHLAGLEPDVLDQRLRDAARAPDLDAFWAPG